MLNQCKNSVLFSFSILAALSSGCSSVLYSNNTAPVYDRTGAQQTASTSAAKKPVKWTPTNPASTHISSKQPAVIEPPIVKNSTSSPYQSVPAIEKPQSTTVNNSRYVENQTLGTTNSDGFGQPLNPFKNSASLDNTDPRIKSASELNNQTDSLSDSAQNSQVSQDNVAVIRPSTPSVNEDTISSNPKAKEVKSNDDTALRPTAPSKPSTPASKQSSETSKTQVSKKAPAEKPTGTGSAVKDLLQSAKESVIAGDYEKAASDLERAHRINPGDSKILFDIAQVRFAQGKYSQAESFASRAAGVAKTNRMKKKIWTLLSKARKALGNNSGAATALKKAQSF